MTARDPWLDWLALSEWEHLSIGTDCMREWPAAVVREFESRGLLQLDAPREYVPCPDCRNEPLEVVHFTHPQTQVHQAVVWCGECGVIDIPLVSLRCWRIHWPALASVLASGLGLRGAPREFVRDRLWQLGKAYEAGRQTTLFLGRAFHRRDVGDVIAPIMGFRNAVILVPRSMPTVPVPHPVVTLDLLVKWAEDQLVFDREFLRGIGMPPQSRERRRPPAKDGHRAAVRQRIRAELEAHIAACRSHVQAALDHGRSPTLLPFPAYAELARRCSTSKATISRCLKEDAELRRMCAAARDLYQQFAQEAG